MQHEVLAYKRDKAKKASGELYIVLCASGFENIPRVKSALMFASLSAAAEMETVVFCVQNAVDVMVSGEIQKNEKTQRENPSLSQRLGEAISLGVRIQCCTQSMKNKGIRTEDLIEGVEPAGAMNLIDLTTKAKGTICF